MAPVDPRQTGRNPEAAPISTGGMSRTVHIEGDGAGQDEIVQVKPSPGDSHLPQVGSVKANRVFENHHERPIQASPATPWCWYCRCVYCLNCDRRPPQHVPCVVSLIDAGVVFFFWLTGLYLPGGRFRRRFWEFFEAQIKVPAGVSRHGAKSIDLSFPATMGDDAESRRIRIRIYEPLPANEHSGHGHNQSPRKVILYFHGGGMVIGDISDRMMHDTCAKISARGNYVIVSADYRKAPEHPFPRAVYDAYDALRWLASCAPEDFPVKNVDKSSVILCGDASGANLALVLSTLVRDDLGPDLQPLPKDFPRISVSQQVLLYPQLFAQHLIKAEQPVKPADMPVIPMPVLDFFRHAYVPGHTAEDVDRLSREDRRLCPLLAGFHHLPHTILISAGLDFLHLEHLVALQELVGCNVDFDYHYFPEEPHAFVNFGDCRKASNECIRIVVQKLRAWDEAHHHSLIPTTRDQSTSPERETIGNDMIPQLHDEREEEETKQMEDHSRSTSSAASGKRVLFTGSRPVD